MSTKKLYALTDSEAKTLRALARESATTVSNYALDALTPIDTDALISLDIEGGVERMARVLADLEPGEPWPTNAELGGGPTGTRDDEYRYSCMDRAHAVLDALLGSEGGTQ